MTTITAGPYVQGEQPAPIEYQFLDENGDPLASFGSTATTFAWRLLSALPADADSAAADWDDTTAKATFTWAAPIATPGLYLGEFVIDNGTNDFHSERIFWVVRQAVAVPA